MKKVLLALVLVLVLALSIAAFAAPRGKGPGPAGPAPGGPVASCQAYLGLTQAQIDKITQLRQAFWDSTADLRADLQAKQQELIKLWTAPTPDVQTIKAKAEQMDQVRAQIRDKSIDLRAAVIAQLTPQQRAKCIERCQAGICGGGAGCGFGMGMGICGMGAGAGMGPGAGGGMGACGAGMGRGMGACGMGAGRGAGMGAGPTGAGCPLGRR